METLGFGGEAEKKTKKENKLRYPSLFVLRIEKQLHLPTHLGWYKADKVPFCTKTIPCHSRARQADP